MDYRSWTNDRSECLPDEAIKSLNCQVSTDLLPIWVIALEEFVGCVCKNISKCNHIACSNELWEDESEAFSDFVGVAKVSYVGFSIKIYFIFVIFGVGWIWRVCRVCFGTVGGSWLLLLKSIIWSEAGKLRLLVSLIHNKSKVLKLSRNRIIIHLESSLSLDLGTDHLSFIELEDSVFSMFLKSLKTRVNGWRNVPLKHWMFGFLCLIKQLVNFLNVILGHARLQHFFVHVVLICVKVRRASRNFRSGHHHSSCSGTHSFARFQFAAGLSKHITV